MDEQESNKVNEIIDSYESELKSTRNKLNEATDNYSQNTLYSGQNENLIVYQLELDNILEKIEHLLRGDVVKQNKEGDLYYSSAPDPNLKTLNEYGVQLIINAISFYLNRNTILSSYDPDRIDTILYDLGDEVADVILCNYEKMGMDNQQKKSRYPLLVLNIMHMVESTYKRALSGGERESLRSARVVTQSDRAMGLGMNQSFNSPEKKFSFMNPKTW